MRRFMENRTLTFMILCIFSNDLFFFQKNYVFENFGSIVFSKYGPTCNPHSQSCILRPLEPKLCVKKLLNEDIMWSHSIGMKTTNAND